MCATTSIVRVSRRLSAATSKDAASGVAAAFTGLLMGIVLANYGVHGVAILIGTFMIVGVILILLKPSTNNNVLEEISSDEASTHERLTVNTHRTIRKTSERNEVETGASLVAVDGSSHLAV